MSHSYRRYGYGYGYTYSKQVHRKRRQTIENRGSTLLISSVQNEEKEKTKV